MGIIDTMGRNMGLFSLLLLVCSVLIVRSKSMILTSAVVFADRYPVARMTEKVKGLVH